ncbi:MAG: hypothetical protein Fur0018_13960 [Anaerolineales bacterium]
MDNDVQQPVIIIVEDEPDTAEMFAEMMRLSGYQVRKCHGGTRGIELIQQYKPDAVLLDIMMPDVSGLDVLHFMQRDPGLQDIPVVVVSAKSMPTDIREGLQAGASLYLTKPVGFDDLRNAVANVIREHRINKK